MQTFKKVQNIGILQRGVNLKKTLIWGQKLGVYFWFLVKNCMSLK